MQKCVGVRWLRRKENSGVCVGRSTRRVTSGSIGITETWKDAHPEEEVAPPRAPRVACDACGHWMRRNNIARHQREACPGSEAGP